MNTIVLRSADGASAEIATYGAHVMSWRPAPGDTERLFLSAQSDLTGHTAIRGGIPVIFPQFAAEGTGPRHGFARTTEWAVVSQSDDEAVFELTSSDATRAVWTAEFVAQIGVRVGGDSLVVSLSVENVGDADFDFAGALHTYLRVHDIAQAEIIGLHGARYRVSSAPQTFIFDTNEAIQIDGEIDRVYVDAPHRITLREPTRELAADSEGFTDVVLWNPGEKAKALADMEPDGERRMVCIEAAVVQERIFLAPERKWSGTQTLISLPSE